MVNCFTRNQIDVWSIVMVNQSVWKILTLSPTQDYMKSNIWMALLRPWTRTSLLRIADEEGHRQILMEKIIDHQSNKDAVK